MASDRARIGFDPTRDYRSVIAQQGRVTLEADFNEEALIAGEALRLETIDIVGPCGTPDDGYAVTLSGGLDHLTIGAGIMYLGGWRLALDKPVEIGQQPDWLDRPPFQLADNDVVSLLITEQSVCAVEDQALRDVALGGPDTAARMRLMQHFLLIGLAGDTCADAASAVNAVLATDGVTLDPASLQVISSATLQVGFTPPATPPDPCSPAAAGGYLGADNQLVRVTVTSFDAKANTGQLLWGWNNASFLYRATLTDPVAGVFTLTGAPVDQEHAPQLGQAVEILRSRADLGDNNYIAAEAGFVTTVTQAYSFDTGQLTIADAVGLPPEYASDTNPLFVRLWQAIVPFNAGQAAALDTTSGLTVTLGMTALPSAIAARPFWRFAVRPNTPTQVYPARYQETPQPPDGPRQWLCDLAVVRARGDGSGLLADCRVTFLPLTEQTGGCCGLTLDPGGVDGRGGLQAVLDSLAGSNAVVFLKAGTYTLPAPLLLTAKHAGIAVEGCSGGVVLQAADAAIADFLLGLIVVIDATDIALRRLEFLLPNVPVAAARSAGSVAPAQGYTVAGVLAARTAQLTIEDCIFRYAPPSPAVFGAGVIALGGARGLTVRACQFAAAAFAATSALSGVLATVNANDVSTTLDDVEISDNRFENLNAGVFCFAQLGMVRCAGNRVLSCGTGFYFAEANLGAASQFAREALASGGPAGPAADLAQGVRAGLQAPLLDATAQSAAPWFAKLASPAPTRPSAAATRILLKDMVSKGTATWTNLVSPQANPAGAPPAPATPAPAATGSARVSAAAAQTNLDYTTALDHLDTISVAAEVAANILTPVLYFRDNDVTLVSPGAKPGVGIGVLFSPKADAGAVMMSGNRTTTPDTNTAAAAVFFPAFAAVNANMFLQPAPALRVPPAPAFILIGEPNGLIEVVGNVIRSTAAIFPDRSAPPPSASWNFLNAEG